jgi:hypothetical protein
MPLHRTRTWSCSSLFIAKKDCDIPHVTLDLTLGDKDRDSLPGSIEGQYFHHPANGRSVSGFEGTLAGLDWTLYKLSFTLSSPGIAPTGFSFQWGDKKTPLASPR